MQKVKEWFVKAVTSRPPEDGPVHAEAPWVEWMVVANLVVGVVWMVLTACHPSPGMQTILAVTEWVIWLAFAVEAWVLHKEVHWKHNLLEYSLLLATFPVLTAAIDLPLQVLWIARFPDVMKIFPGIVGRSMTASLGKFSVMLLVMVGFGGGMAYAMTEEGVNAFDGIWWGVITFTSVGYGDLYPHSVYGRIVAMTVAILGAVFHGLVMGAAAAWAHERMEKQRAVINRILRRENGDNTADDEQDRETATFLHVLAEKVMRDAELSLEEQLVVSLVRKSIELSK